MKSKPIYSDPFQGYRELTLRGIVLGVLITVIFTASNIYLGLKVGLTFASSIPAAVLSMAILKFAKDSNILENNQVQTQASAAGTLSSVVFVIPGLLMMGYWQDFPFWQTAMICMAGGILGVIFTIPLRYVMVVNSSLPYPEGVAAAEILKAGASGRVADEHGNIIRDQNHAAQEQNVKEIIYGGVFAAIVAFFSSALRLISDSSQVWFKVGSAIFQLPMGYSMALLGAGSLIGIAAGVAILVGIVIAWGIAVPVFSSMQPMPEGMEMAAYAKQIWSQKVRMIGVGTIGIAAIWTLIVLSKPMLEGVRLSIAAYASRGEIQTQMRASRDLHPKHMLMIVAATALILFCTFYYFVADSGLPTAWAWGIVTLVTLLTMLIGFLVAAACGYMAGVVGSSSSPISGIGILSVLAFAVILLLIGNHQGLASTDSGIHFLIALTLFASSTVLAIACISNDNLQDLKTGYLVHASPAKQQISLIIGCIVGALVIAPVLGLLYQAYGFSGAMPRPDMDMSQVLAAPQALLMTTIAQGIFSHQLVWNYILIGVALGIGLIILDIILRRSSNQLYSLPVLCVGLGIYLPPAVNMPLFIGALLFWLIKRQVKKTNGPDQQQRLANVEQRGTLFAAGLIVGESLMGVILAMIIVFSTTTGGSDAPLAIKLSNWDNIANILGLAVFILAMYLFAKRALRK
ncbi:putative OPT family oligopeptide transporter [Acinetobacter calcoaceticus]|uniref:Putative OPT family oligopeptide transporter n=1 Tax=Acinetobacter calcoaceticus TaxID=471 RepID=A0A4R1XY12_ACICA|nr:putative OPT family oligopeptide transporter [Acinetobacter calcoaceticus]